jgi:hypothetical protein
MIKLRLLQCIATLYIFALMPGGVNAQVLDYVYDIPDLYCDGAPVRIDTFGPVLPAGMFLYRNDSGTPAAGAGMAPGWQLVQDPAIPGNYYLSATSWYMPAVPVDNRLVIEVNLPAAPICLSFRAWSLDMEYPENLEVWLFGENVAHSDMLTGTLIATYDSLSTDRNHKTLDLSPYAGQNVRIGFRHAALDGFKIGLDDIRITQTEQRDYALISAGFQYKPTLGDTMDVLFRIANKGSDPLIYAKVVWSIQPAGIMDSMMYNGDTLSMNTSALVTIPQVWIPTSAGVQTLCVHISELSQNPVNDTLCVMDTVQFAVSKAHDVSSELWNVFPVPADAFLNIPIAENWQVYNMQGEMMLEGFNHNHLTTVSTQHWPNGIYVLHALTDTGFRTLKFSVLHP